MNTSTTVLVTGITGFLAGHIADRLLREGYRVRGTVRHETRRLLLEQAGAHPGRLEIVEADLDQDANWDSAASGCDYVIHCASPFPSVPPRDPMDVIRPARDGTARVLRAAHRGGVTRVVLTSSVAATNHGSGRAPFTEADWTDPDGRRATAYYRSKTLAERDAWAYAEAVGLELTVLNPGTVLSPLLTPQVGSSTGLVLQLLRGAFRGIPRFGFSIADVRDVADAHVRALTAPGAGNERFIVSGRFLWMRQLRDILAHEFPEYAARLPRTETPSWLVRLMALASPTARGIVHELGRDLSVSTAKAESALQWTARPVEDTIRSTVDSFHSWGILPTTTTHERRPPMTTPAPEPIEHIRGIERARLKALVSGDLDTAAALHADDFQLITPIGAALSKREYLGAIASGQIAYVHWEPGPIDVRLTGSVATIRYRAELDVVFGGHRVPRTGYWHTDTYELTESGWQAVWSQATQIQ